MILNGYVASGSMAVKFGPSQAKCNPLLGSFTCRLDSSQSWFSHISTSAVSPKFKSLHLSCKEHNILSSKGGSTLHLSGLSHSLTGEHGQAAYTRHLWPQFCKLPPRASMVPQASKSVSYPQMTEKPQWWWRSLACVPYLIPIAETLVCAETGFHIQHFLEDLGFLTYPLLDTMAVMPSWFMMAFSFIVYLWVVRRKELPHFLRFHVIMAMLFSSAVQIVNIASDWLPTSVYRGEILQRFWITFALLQLFTVFECIRCALSGTYADVPFVSDAAYFHTYIR